MKLWLLYIYYVEVVKMLIRAERFGYWNFHVVAISKMLNLFAATGHINYAKSIYFFHFIFYLFNVDIKTEYIFGIYQKNS